ncbi:MAG: hypothetical protein KC900_07735 [Candidatus Omnitrophica bacterium]|nr:hypothetical protein [Candidatus Omnitrophota bacterium]
MKARWHNLISYILAMALVIAAVPVAAQTAETRLTRKEALVVAESTEEAELLYTMYDGRLKNCIEKEVVKPCESDWVTCIENAWVVQFTVGEICGIEQDGRLGLTILIDALTGRVLSKFPEADYFRGTRYCMDDSDCICGRPTNQGRQCFNFISAQVEGVSDFQCRACRCVQSECTVGTK